MNRNEPWAESSTMDQAAAEAVIRVHRGVGAPIFQDCQVCLDLKHRSAAAVERPFESSQITHQLGTVQS